MYGFLSAERKSVTFANRWYLMPVKGQSRDPTFNCFGKTFSRRKTGGAFGAYLGILLPLKDQQSLLRLCLEFHSKFLSQYGSMFPIFL